MVMEWEAESDEAGAILATEPDDEAGQRVEASSEDLVDAVGRARRARLAAANLAVDEVIFEPSF